MGQRYLCIHGHFYQPPRENPWLETVDTEDSAYPFHDWNERITAECYAANTASRILDARGRIVRTVNTYSRISFNMGPTLLSWLQQQAPDTYAAILQADRDSAQRYSGHGSALAQAYNHLVLPLANQRDKVTQVRWGIADFAARFGRQPEGMWLPETAVDLETLDVLAQHGIRFTVLAPHQAARVRPLAGGHWQDVTAASLDTRRAYLQRLPSGHTIVLFFYDGDIAQGVAFNGLLRSGDGFATRLTGGFDRRDGPQLVHIATDGESYGHHHRFGDMALSYAITQLEAAERDGITLTNYGEFLERFPPEFEVEIVENTSWSCAHGVERWRSDCGCSTGAHHGWQQAWRPPLRNALDALRDDVEELFEQQGQALFADPWAARNGYVALVLDRSDVARTAFLTQNGKLGLTAEQVTQALQLLEMQRHALLMYTSCGWFFDDIGGLEAAQVLLYAARAAELARRLDGRDRESGLLARLSEAASNLPDIGNGAAVYRRAVDAARVDMTRMVAHFAETRALGLEGAWSGGAAGDPRATVTPLSERDSPNFYLRTAGMSGTPGFFKAHLVVLDKATREVGLFKVAASRSDSAVVCGVAPIRIDASLPQLAPTQEEVAALLQTPTYGLAALLPDALREWLQTEAQRAGLAQATAVRAVYPDYVPASRVLTSVERTLPRAWDGWVGEALRSELQAALAGDDIDASVIRTILAAAARWSVVWDAEGLGYRFTGTVDRLAVAFERAPHDLGTLRRLAKAVAVATAPDVPARADLWRAQNAAITVLRDDDGSQRQASDGGDSPALAWGMAFDALCRALGVQRPHA